MGFMRILAAGLLCAAALTGCHSGRAGSDADRVACNQLGTALGLANAHTPSAILVADYRTAAKSAASATDPRLRASILSMTRFATTDIRVARNPQTQAAYATLRCRAIDSAFPSHFSIQPLPASTTPTAG